MRADEVAFELPRAAGRALEGVDSVAQGGSLLVAPAFGGRFHLGLELSQPLAGFALEEFAGRLEAFGVCFGGDLVVVLVDLGAGVVVEAPATVLEFHGGGVTEQDTEAAAELGQSFAKVAGMGEWPIVARVAVGAVAGEPEAGERFAGVHADKEEALVVREVCVVARLEFFDQLPLQEERLGL